MVPCSSQYLGFAVGEGPEEPVGDDLIFVELALIGVQCDRFAEEHMAFNRELPDSTVEDIAGLEVVVAGTEMAWVDDGIAFHIHLVDPANRERFRPFIDAFIAHQAALPAVG